MKVLFSTDEGSFSYRFRKKRMDHWWKFMDSVQGRKVLDVGGTEVFWRNFGGERFKELDLTLLNLEPVSNSAENVNSLVGDATDLSCFIDGSFDVVFSNSVIEHLEDRKRQEQMAKEIMRVGKAWYVQTPNRGFLIEPHFIFPAFQFLPERMQYHVALRWPLARRAFRNPKIAEQSVREIRLLSRAEMCELFPTGKVELEKVCGFCKSITLWNSGD